MRFQAAEGGGPQRVSWAWRWASPQRRRGGVKKSNISFLLDYCRGFLADNGTRWAHCARHWRCQRPGPRHGPSLCQCWRARAAAGPACRAARAGGAAALPAAGHGPAPRGRDVRERRALGARARRAALPGRGHGPPPPLSLSRRSLPRWTLRSPPLARRPASSSTAPALRRPSWCWVKRACTPWSTLRASCW